MGSHTQMPEGQCGFRQKSQPVNGRGWSARIRPKLTQNRESYSTGCKLVGIVMGLLALGVLGTGLLGVVIYDWLDDDDSSPVVDTPIEEEGQDIVYDGSDLLEGTEGDDTIAAGQDETLAPDVINLFGGDDTATIEVNDPITVNGGEGDDLLTATGVLNTLDGGEGDDTLTADDSNRLLGGEGDDVLNFNHGSYDQGENGSADGGEGDDTINVRADAFVPAFLQTDVGGVEVTGGSGADEFNVTYEANDNFTFEPTDDVRGSFVTINDFDPNEDSLVVEVEQDTDMPDREVEVDLNQTEEDGVYTSLITLRFEETADAVGATNVLTVVSTDPFTLDDIELVGV